MKGTFTAAIREKGEGLWSVLIAWLLIIPLSMKCFCLILQFTVKNFLLWKRVKDITLNSTFHVLNIWLFSCLLILPPRLWIVILTWNHESSPLHFFFSFHFCLTTQSLVRTTVRKICPEREGTTQKNVSSYYSRHSATTESRSEHIHHAIETNKLAWTATKWWGQEVILKSHQVNLNSHQVTWTAIKLAWTVITLAWKAINLPWIANKFV